MIFIGILASIAAIGALCWLLFTLAVFALPFFAGVSAGTWAYQTGAGWLGAIIVGLIAAALTPRPWAVPARLHPSALDTPRDRCRVRRARSARRLPRDAWHRETHHALRHLADHLLRHRRNRRWHHGADPGDSNGAPGPTGQNVARA